MCTVLALFILTNTLPPAEVGLIVAAQAAGTIGALFVTLNQEGGAIRYLPQWRRETPHLVNPFLGMLGRPAQMPVLPVSHLA